MANTSSAQKMIRKIERRTRVNKHRRSQVRSYIRKVEEAIATGNVANARVALKTAQPHLHRAVSKGIFHRNKVARKLSRLSSQINALTGAPN